MKYLVDTNVLVRYLVRDNEDQYLRVVKWFRKAEKGEMTLVIKPMVVSETVFVLKGFYKISLIDIEKALKSLLTVDWLEVEDRSALIDVWDWYGTKIHFVDAYLLASAKAIKSKVLTFDKEMKKEKVRLTRAWKR